MRNKVWVIRVMSFRRSGMDPGGTTESHDPEIGFAVPWKSRFLHDLKKLGDMRDPRYDFRAASNLPIVVC
jgi:hypothetical protein